MTKGGGPVKDKSPERIPEADRALWQTQMQGVKPKPRHLQHKKKHVALPEMPPAAPLLDAAQAVADPLRPHRGWKKLMPMEGALQLVKTQLPQQSMSENPSIDPHMLKQLQRAKRQIDAKIDLHHLTQSQAHKALLHFIYKALAEGRRTVLVITGKSGGPNRPESVLRKNLSHWLMADAKLAQEIIGISPAAPQHGGAGAFYVALRSKKKQ